jgi:hypothetical protein
LNELGNKYPLAAIRERRAEMAGEITSLQKRLRQLRESLVHVDATIRLFDPDGDPTKIPGKRPYKRVKLFGAGKAQPAHPWGSTARREPDDDG